MSSTVSQATEDARAKLQQLRPLLFTMKKGYFGLHRLDRPGEIDFIKIIFPKTGSYAGCFKLSSLHGDTWTPEITVDDDSYAWIHEARWLGVLTNLIPNTLEAQMLYATEKGRCCSCGKTLTLERSRYYGIGPECEGRNQTVIAMVDERYGEYYPGKTLDLAEQAVSQ